MNQDQYFVNLFPTVNGSLKQNYVRCLALLKFLGLGNKCWKRCALQNFTAVVLSRLFGVWSISAAIPFFVGCLLFQSSSYRTFWAVLLIEANIPMFLF